MAGSRRYSDRQLASAIAASSSWRGTLRQLGLAASSSASIKSVRRHADRLSLDYSHFTRGRKWTDGDLERAVLRASSWQSVVDELGLVGSASIGFVKRHALRLRLDAEHLDVRDRGSDGGFSECASPDLANLPQSGSMIAAAWFSMCGYAVNWPLEPCRYDLAVIDQRGRTRRVQVKTTLSRESNGSWRAHVSTNGRHESRVYTADEIDDFFIIDGDLNLYLIPIEAIQGLHYATLRAYDTYRVREA